MTQQRLKKLGIEKPKALASDFDTLYEFYKKRAIEAGCEGEIKFIKEHNKVFIYVVIWHVDYHTGDVLWWDSGLQNRDESLEGSIPSSCAEAVGWVA